MAFKAPSKPMQRSKSLQTKKPLQAKSGLTARLLSPSEQIKAQKKALKTSTIRVLDKARREAAEQGVALSEWETEFIEDVTERVKTYGRAFADPDKGALNGTLSMRQGQKLKEIRRKVKNKSKGEKSNDDET